MSETSSADETQNADTKWRPLSSPVSTKHYKAAQPRSFSADERDQVTLLFGGLTWKHHELVQAVFQNMGYRAQPLPPVKRADLDVGRAVIDSGACCPTTFTTGNLTAFLESEVVAKGASAVSDQFAYLTAG